jgi:hypothetical protein
MSFPSPQPQVVTDALDYETLSMGRQCSLVEYAELAGEVLVVVYDVEPSGHARVENRQLHERRVATFVRGKLQTSQIVRAEWREVSS